LISTEVYLHELYGKVSIYFKTYPTVSNFHHFSRPEWFSMVHAHLIGRNGRKSTWRRPTRRVSGYEWWPRETPWTSCMPKFELLTCRRWKWERGTDSGSWVSIYRSAIAG